MSNDYVTDTMALILRIEKRKLSQKVKTIFEAVEKGKIRLKIPTLVIKNKSCFQLEELAC